MGKALNILLFVGAVCGCHPGRPGVQAPCSDPIENLEWLAGSWKDATGAIEEHWTQPRGDSMLGLGHTVQLGKTTAFEFLRITSRPNGVYYVAQPQGGPPTGFNLTSCSPRSATFENPSHDFPRIITYREHEGRLLIHLEGEEHGRKATQDMVLLRAKSK